MFRATWAWSVRAEAVVTDVTSSSAARPNISLTRSRLYKLSLLVSDRPSWSASQDDTEAPGWGSHYDEDPGRARVFGKSDVAAATPLGARRRARRPRRASRVRGPRAGAPAPASRRPRGRHRAGSARGARRSRSER